MWKKGTWIQQNPMLTLWGCTNSCWQQIAVKFLYFKELFHEVWQNENGVNKDIHVNCQNWFLHKPCFHNSNPLWLGELKVAELNNPFS